MPCYNLLALMAVILIIFLNKQYMSHETLEEKVEMAVMNYKVIGTGSAYPVCSKSNDDLATFLDTSDEWISTRTGIKSRHVCTKETISDLAVNAGKAALQNANIDASELDYIICSTIRGDYITPSLACVVQKEIGANCPAYDINAACSGFLYALDTAAGYFARGCAKKVLVIAAEVMSKMVNWQDRATCVLFGDGAGAVVLSEGSNLLSIKLTANGNTDYLRIPHVNGNSPFSDCAYEDSFLHMQGQDVYKFAVISMARDLADVIEEAGLEQSDVDFVLPHQANMRIIDSAKKKLKIAPEKYYTNIETCGNTSCAGVAMLLDELNRKNLFQPGSILALASFGAGLTTGACVIRW